MVARRGTVRLRDGDLQLGAASGRELQPDRLDAEPPPGRRHARTATKVERVPGGGGVDDHRVASGVADVDRRAPRRGDDHAGRPRRDGDHGGEGNRRDHRAITVNVTPAE